MCIFGAKKINWDEDEKVKQLFSEQIFDIIEVEHGFIVVYKRAEIDDKVVVSYKSVSLDDGVVTQRTRADYEYVKYGENYPKITFNSGNFVNNSCVKLDNGRYFAVSVDGEAKIIDAEGIIEWEGTIKYKNAGPSSIAGFGHTLWASFAEQNALIRFNLRTMREELRIGGSIDSAFASPKGMWVDEPAGKLIVCNTKGKNILEVNMKTYTVVEKAVFDEGVHKYLKIGDKEFVILDSGLYML
jgi:hypothetical protein